MLVAKVLTFVWYATTIAEVILNGGVLDNRSLTALAIASLWHAVVVVLEYLKELQ
jgi:hypothetical protein